MLFIAGTRDCLALLTCGGLVKQYVHIYIYIYIYIYLSVYVHIHIDIRVYVLAGVVSTAAFSPVEAAAVDS